MNAVTSSAIQSAVDSAYPERVVVRAGAENDTFTVTRSRQFRHVQIMTGTRAAGIVIEVTPTVALELSLALRRQAETLQRELVVRGGVA